MKKPLLTTILTAMTIYGLTFVNCFHFSMAQTGTQVSGIISQETTWTEANSPYIVTGPTAVNKGATLTIEAGAKVNLNGYYLQVNGTLIARGTTTELIRFNGGQIQFTQESVGWNQTTDSGSIITYAIISGVITITSSSPMISDSSLTSSIGSNSYPIEIAGGSPIISGNYFYSAEYGDNYGRLQATNTGIFVNGNPLITDNDFSGGPIIIVGGSPLIQRNHFEGGSNNLEVNLTSSYSNPTVQNNTFTFCRN